MTRRDCAGLEGCPEAGLVVDVDGDAIVHETGEDPSRGGVEAILTALRLVGYPPDINENAILLVALQQQRTSIR
jgi:hypothetical protein